MNNCQKIFEYKKGKFLSLFNPYKKQSRELTSTYVGRAEYLLALEICVITVKSKLSIPTEI
jgi:hypothetical protein